MKHADSRISARNHHFRVVARLALAGALLVSSAADAAPQKVTPPDARTTIAEIQKIPPGGVDELKAIEIGGIKQWVSIRGSDPSNPILLLLHGGPGSAMMSQSWTFQRPWEDFFTVVQWDQRGAGKTFSTARRKPDPSMTIDRIQADTEELIEWLRHTYGKKKIFLMGHSWGTILGVRVAQHHPEWLYAYIGVGQVVDIQRNETVGYQQTLAQAEAVGNQTAIRELKAIAPYPEADGSTPLAKITVERKWDVALGGMAYGRSAVNVAAIRKLSPAYTDYDDKSYDLGELSSVKILLPQLTKISFNDLPPFQCPVVLFVGAHDRTTPATLAEEFYGRLSAPSKKLIKIERAAHLVFNEAQGEVLVHLVQDVRPFSQPGANH